MCVSCEYYARARLHVERQHDTRIFAVVAEHELSERYPDIVRDLAKKLALLNVSHIDQSTFPPVEDVGVPDFEKCGDGKKLRCAMPWLGPRGASCPA